MCHFITLIAPTDDLEAVRTVMDRHGRTARAVDNPSIRKVLGPDDRQYLTTRGHCDCGTVLVTRPGKVKDALEEKLAKKASQMARRGWSQAKIDRAMSDARDQAESRPEKSGGDSLELWASAIDDLQQELHLAHVGLLVRFYSGAVASERFEAARREAPKDLPVPEALASMTPDEVTIFRRR